MDRKDFLLLTHEDFAGLLPDTLQILPVLRKKSILKNDAGEIMLYDPDDRLIEWLFYDEDWHDNEYFRAGGWTLERIDPDRFCGKSSNWKTSRDPAGGTPGRKNSAMTAKGECYGKKFAFGACA